MRKALLTTVLALTAAVTAAPSAGADTAAIGQTPGTYSPWLAPGNASWFTMPMKLQHDPGNYNAYWSTQFSFTGDASAYTGFQTHRDGGGMFLVSVWGGTGAVAGNNGSYCQDFSEGGTGKTCRNNARPVEGHQYELSGVKQGDGSWRFSYVDLTANTSTTLGTISFGGGNDVEAGSFNSWTEYFDWNDPSTVCADAKYSKLLFGQPRTSAGLGKYGSPYTSKTCADIAKVTVGSGGATHEDGIGQ
ncbi:hypothetical protein [Amycolatopsis sp. CA-230715]|uniref:hypothetical protein n=1 Tax=Amycolatopsis sp. CA-230715 TaxID=2745196 RepID=UPI001C03593B|nr:hypothetical protein [Amycolatopsis sp. CA-230715]QWF83814.1 hypothetical protein HUW46_07257 [Amycolatopsis sp. CA-230715]